MDCLWFQFGFEASENLSGGEMLHRILANLLLCSYWLVLLVSSCDVSWFEVLDKRKKFFLYNLSFYLF